MARDPERGAGGLAGNAKRRRYEDFAQGLLATGLTIAPGFCPDQARQEAAELDEAERLLREIEEERQREATKRERKRRKLDAAGMAKAAGELLEASPGSEAPARLPLRLLTSQRAAAWRWNQDGKKMTYMVPIGSSQPFSPFSDEEPPRNDGTTHRG
mmetsp:Transcript_73328/g.192270  ORF Transcript_73328/g.192270 Transcript_73328/m.192270 type:complete len:157 (-) Transcript_73328:9-479(-)